MEPVAPCRIKLSPFTLEIYIFADQLISSRQYPNVSSQGWKGSSQPAPHTTTASLGRPLLSSLPHHQLLHGGAEGTRNTPGTTLTKAGNSSSSRALHALKKATQIVAVARNARGVLNKRPRRQSERDVDVDIVGSHSRGVSSSSPSGGEGESGSADKAILGDEDEEDDNSPLVGVEAPRDAPAVAEPKTVRAVVARENERQPWVVTEAFYAHLETATARLDAKYTPEKG